MARVEVLEDHLKSPERNVSHGDDKDWRGLLIPDGGGGGGGSGSGKLALALV